jgi:hypothetical protein
MDNLNLKANFVDTRKDSLCRSPFVYVSVNVIYWAHNLGHYYSHSASHYPSLLSASSDFIRGQNVGASLQDTLGLELRIF